MKPRPIRHGVLAGLAAVVALACGARAVETPARDAAANETGAGGCASGETLYYRNPGCGANAVGVCVSALPECFGEYCSCSGKTISGCGGATEPWSAPGKCVTDAGAEADASGSDAGCQPGMMLQYDAPGCGVAPKCLPPPPPCADEFCGCGGVTIIGCGTTSEPYVHTGPC